MLTRLWQAALEPSSRGGAGWPAAFGLTASVIVCAIHGVAVLSPVFRHDLVIHDDAVQHIVWMFRFIDPGLFPNDLIADYYQAISPAGFALFYRALALAGIDPLLLSRVLPIVIALATTVLAYRVCMRLLPVPFAAFLASVLLNQALWSDDDLLSGTPRAFASLLILLLLAGVLRRSAWIVGIAVVAAGLVFPPVLLIAAGMLALGLVRRKSGRIRFVETGAGRRAAVIGLGLAGMLLVWYFLQSSGYGPIATRAEALSMPEFQAGGRSAFFFSSPIDFWILQERPRVLPWRPDTLDAYFLVVLAIGGGLPLLRRARGAFPLADEVSADVRVLAHLAAVTIGLYFAAHALLFKLYLPSRYVTHSGRVLMAVAGGIVMTMAFDAALRSVRARRLPATLVAGTLIAIVAGLLVLPARVNFFAGGGFRYGQSPELYQFFSRQPPDILIASLSREADFIPAFAQRSVLAAEEYAVPYHMGYFSEIRKRTLDLIRAHYTPNVAELQAFVRQRGVDFVVIDRTAFSPGYLHSRRWIEQYLEDFPDLPGKLDRGETPALQSLLPACVVLGTPEHSVVDASCVLKAAR